MCGSKPATAQAPRISRSYVPPTPEQAQALAEAAAGYGIELVGPPLS